MSRWTRMKGPSLLVCQDVNGLRGVMGAMQTEECRFEWG